MDGCGKGVITGEPDIGQKKIKARDPQVMYATPKSISHDYQARQTTAHVSSLHCSIVPRCVYGEYGPPSVNWTGDEHLDARVIDGVRRGTKWSLSQRYKRPSDVLATEMLSTGRRRRAFNASLLFLCFSSRFSHFHRPNSSSSNHRRRRLTWGGGHKEDGNMDMRRAMVASSRPRCPSKREEVSSNSSVRSTESYGCRLHVQNTSHPSLRRYDRGH